MLYKYPTWSTVIICVEIYLVELKWQLYIYTIISVVGIYGYVREVSGRSKNHKIVQGLVHESGLKWSCYTIFL